MDVFISSCLQPCMGEGGLVRLFPMSSLPGGAEFLEMYVMYNLSLQTTCNGIQSFFPITLTLWRFSLPLSGLSLADQFWTSSTPQGSAQLLRGWPSPLFSAHSHPLVSCASKWALAWALWQVFHHHLPVVGENSILYGRSSVDFPYSLCGKKKKKFCLHLHLVSRFLTQCPFVLPDFFSEPATTSARFLWIKSNLQHKFIVRSVRQSMLFSFGESIF